MEKYAVEDDALLSGLRNEEHTLMVEISRHMSGRKTAAEQGQFDVIQHRLNAIRDKITSIDLKGKGVL